MLNCKINVLLVEDNPADARLVELSLAGGKWAEYRVVSAKSLSEAMGILRNEAFDVILLDLSLPDSMGLETLRAMRRAQPPTIVLTGLSDEDTAKDSLNDGAQDYLIKGESHCQDLERAIRYAIQRHRFSAERIRQALRATKTATWSWSIADDIIVWDEMLPMLTSIDTNIQGHRFADFISLVHQEDRRLVTDAVSRSLSEDVPYDARFRIQLPDGSTYHLAARGTVERDAEGRPVKMIGVCMDITEQKKTQDALKSSEARMRAILDAAVDAIVTMDHEGRIVDCNPATERTFGYSHDELIGRLAADTLVPPAHRDAYIKELQRYLETGESRAIGRRFEITALHRDGKEFPVELSLTVVRMDHHPPLFTALLQDITQRKESEAQLEQAWITAQSASLAKSEFLARMSHELRTPLNGVIGMTELLLHTKLDSHQQHYARIAKTSGDALLTLVNDVLDLSKIEAGKMELEAIEFDPRAIVESVAELLGHQAAAKKLELSCQVEDDVPLHVQGDPSRLHQILTNLVNNAIKFTENGEVFVKTDCIEKNDKDVELRFTVNDTGIGIQPDRVECLFHSFSQVDSSTTRKYGGTGLGLSICKHLVEMMNGRIGVDSVAGQGSTFWFTARFTISRRPETDETPRGWTSRSDGRQRRALVVDDNATNREILERSLTKWGFLTTTASGGAAALEKLQAAAKSGEPYDLAILDYQMPGMNGEDLARAVAALPDLSETQMIMLTSATNYHTGGNLPPTGVRAVLAKPVRQSKLHDTLSAIFVSSPGAPPSETNESSRSSPAPALRNCKPVLVAEDNEINQAVIAGILERAGILFETAANGRIAAEAVERGDFSAVLMDCHMPDMDGFEATVKIRRYEAKAALDRRIPIIAVTADAVQGDREACLAAGMDAYIAKPVEPRKLIEILEPYLAPRNEGATLPPEIPLANTTGRPRGRDSKNDEKPSVGSESAMLDLLLHRWDGDRELIRRIVAKFQERLPLDLRELERCVRESDAAALVQAAHGLKGAAGYLCAEKVRETADELERIGRSQELKEAPDVLARLQKHVRICEPELSSILTSLKTAKSPQAVPAGGA